MLVNDYGFSLMMFRGDGTPLGYAAVAVDWDPAVEQTRFDHARRGRIPVWAEGDALIEPEWDPSMGEPSTAGFHVSIRPRDGESVRSKFGSAYFRHAASSVSDELVRLGKLESGETWLYRVFAHRRNGDNGATVLDLAVIEETPAIEVIATPLDGFLRHGLPQGVVDSGDMPVFIPEQVLEETSAMTLAASGCETGGVLIGHLRRDTSLPEIFIEVTAQIPAEHTNGSSTKLTFTADTWAAANAAIRLRRCSEIFLGYWHSHPVRHWCEKRGCSLEKQSVCSLASFFSSDDKAVMRAAFPRAFSIGLVANDTAVQGVTFSLYGWRGGGIEQRGFYTMEDQHA